MGSQKGVLQTLQLLQSVYHIVSYNDQYYTAWGQMPTLNAQDLSSQCRAPRCELTGLTAQMSTWNVMTHDVCSIANMMTSFTIDMDV